jgi:hypothetical protein
MSRIILPVLCVVIYLNHHAAAAPPELKLLGVQKVWDKAPHCAFTDLVLWKGKFVCAFREGRGHVSTDGRVRMLTSDDGETWSPQALLSLDGYDLRDAGLSIAPDGRLMLIGGAAPRKADNESAPTGSFVAFSADAATWTKPEIVTELERWLWRVTWHNGQAYGISYASVRPEDADLSTRLLVSADGVTYDALVPRLFGEGMPTEATLRVATNGTMYCLQRRDGKGHPSAYLGSSYAPYKNWQWHDLKVHVGGPNFIQLPSGDWIAAGRFFDSGPAKTKLAWLDVDKNEIKPVLELPSGGDCSYPGLVYRDGVLWMSYYSSHEGKANIYLAKVGVE